MAANLLNSRKVNSGLNQFGDGSVSQDMRGDDFQVETGADHGVAKWLLHSIAMTRQTCPRARRWKDPAFCTSHFHFPPQQVRQSCGDRLFATATLCLRNLQPQLIKIDLLEIDCAGFRDDASQS